MTAIPFQTSVGALPTNWQAPQQLMPAPSPQARVLVGSTPGLVDPQMISRVQSIAQGLNAPIPAWNIQILPEQLWQQWMQTDAAALKTGSTFSLLGANRTYVRQSAVVGKRDDQIQDMLAHELGHITTGSHDEDVANKARASYYKTKKWL